MDVEAVAAYLSERSVEQPFLLTRLVVDQLRVAPVDTDEPGWQDRIADSIEAAFEADLASVDSTSHRDLPAGVTAARFAKRLLVALTWGYGAGLPEDEWRTIASAVVGGLGVGEVTGGDVAWVLGQTGRYVVQDGEAGVAVYRLAHQSLTDRLRPAYDAGPEAPFDPEARTVAEALLDRYRTLLEAGIPASEPVYLWRYAWRHAAAAGDDGVAPLRRIMGSDPLLAIDVALAALEVAATYAFWGRHGDALAATEEAVGLYRPLAGDNPTYLPDLARALNNLGNRYAEIGDADAVDREWAKALTQLAPTGQAVLLLYRAQTAASGSASAAAWLTAALQSTDTPEVVLAVRRETRRHRASDPVAFDSVWQQRTGSRLPEWALIEQDDIELALRWVTTPTYRDEYEYLRDNPRLLDEEVNLAVEEASQIVDREEAGRLSQLRERARAGGVDAAYRPLLLRVLAAEFAAADPAGQRAMLTARRDDLLDDLVLEELNGEGDARLLRAAALLQLVGAGADEVLAVTWEAFDEPELFATLLHGLASGQPELVQPVALCALSVAVDVQQAGLALLYLALAAVMHDEDAAADELLSAAYQNHPAAKDAWIRELAKLGSLQPAALRLISQLVDLANQEPPPEHADELPEEGPR